MDLSKLMELALQIDVPWKFIALIFGLILALGFEIRFRNITQRLKVAENKIEELETEGKKPLKKNPSNFTAFRQ